MLTVEITRTEFKGSSSHLETILAPPHLRKILSSHLVPRTSYLEKNYPRTSAPSHPRIIIKKKVIKYCMRAREKRELQNNST